MCMKGDELGIKAIIKEQMVTKQNNTSEDEGYKAAGPNGN